jgi:outer membrane protein assembly factor BamB
MIATFRVVLGVAACLAQTAASARTYGWRGNWTGLYPDADPPTVWDRTPTGPTRGLRNAATKLPEDQLDQADAAGQGLLTQWQVAGPFPVADSVKDLPNELFPGEADLVPVDGKAVNGQSWRPFKLERNRFEFGRAELEWVDLAAEAATDVNRVGYAHTWLFAQTAGRLRAVVDHHFGLKVWVNGKAVYTDPRRRTALGYYTAISRHKLANSAPKSPAFEFEVRKGWNRLLCKVSTADKPGWGDGMRFAMRVGEVEGVAYAQRNIRWMAELPERGNATPLVIGDRIFVAVEPDELLCLDKRDGRRLWRAFVNYESATPPGDRSANPLFVEKVDPLVERLNSETDADARLAVRRELSAVLVSIDKRRYTMKLDGHFESHFGIVGFMTPTPCGDGKHIYVWSGAGVAACFDLDGNRKWITRPAPDAMAFYASSPAIQGDRLFVYSKKLYALNARTGEVLWSQRDVNKNNAAVLPARLAGVDCVVSQQGEVVRSSDGAMLYANPKKIGGDTGWAAPAIIGDVVYLPWSGMSSLLIMDFAKCTGETWNPVVRSVNDITDNRRPDGKWLDRWTAASPVIYEGRFFDVDIYGTFYAGELSGKARPSRQDLPPGGMFHYNAVPVAASPTLAGPYLYVMDNQGTCVVLDPRGTGAPKVVATNHIGTQLKRDWPVSPQETIAYAPVVPDGRRLFIRGERYLYCIGEE